MAASEALPNDERFGDLIDLAVRDVNALRQAVARDPEILRVHDNLAETLLHWLVIEGHVGPVRCLLELGADANTCDHIGNPVLCDAIVLKRPEMAELLLEAGARPDVTDAGSGESALVLAVRRGRADLVGSLLRHGASVGDAPSLLRDSISDALKSCPKASRAEIRRLLKQHDWRPGQA